MDGWMVKMHCVRICNGWMDGKDGLCEDGWMDRWMDGKMDELGSELTCRIRQAHGGEGRGEGAKFLI